MKFVISRLKSVRVTSMDHIPLLAFIAMAEVSNCFVDIACVWLERPDTPHPAGDKSLAPLNRRGEMTGPFPGLESLIKPVSANGWIIDVGGTHIPTSVI